MKWNRKVASFGSSFFLMLLSTTFVFAANPLGSAFAPFFDLMNYIMEWCEATNEDECKAVINNVKVEKNIFIGEFIKAILKINNITKEFEKVCEFINNMTLLEKLKQIPVLTLKYVATSQSLYI